MWKDPVCHRYVNDFQDHLVEGKYYSEYDIEYENNSSAASETDPSGEIAVQSARLTLVTPQLVSCVDDDVGRLPLTAVDCMEAVRFRSRSESRIITMGCTSGSSPRMLMVSVIKHNCCKSSKSVDLTLSVDSLADSNLISPRSLADV